MPRQTTAIECRPPEDPRSRAQKLLDGLVAAAVIALSTTRLPRNGGLRPQVMVTIDHQTLLGQLAKFGRTTSEAMLAGPIHPDRIRQLACDADIIPLVLGGAGQVLDVGRAQRLFTEAQKKALYARDRGCTFPGCTMPALWTEAHHVEWWSRGGPTSVDNGACICSFHHHLVHAGSWEIDMVNGVPYWIPPAYVDPERRRLRNIYFHPEIRDALFTV